MFPKIFVFFFFLVSLNCLLLNHWFSLLIADLVIHMLDIQWIRVHRFDQIEQVVYIAGRVFVAVVIFIGEGVGLGVRNGAFKIPTMNHESSFSHPTVRWLYLF